MPALTFSAKPHRQAVPTGEGHEALVASLQGQPSGSGRVPLDVVLVLDRSGSMQGGKLQLLKRAVAFCIGQLTASDTLSLVTFDDRVRTELRHRSMDPAGKQQASRSCAAIKAGGSTNLSGGLVQGLGLLAGLPAEPGRSASLLLFTDGRPNQGVLDQPGLLNCLEGAAGGISRPFSLYSFGFGADHDPDVLRALADARGGLYYFVETTEIPESFADCLGGLLSVVAQNVTVTVQPADGHSLVPVVTKYPLELHDPTSGGCTITVGDINAEERKDLVLQLKLPAAGARTVCCSLRLDYFDPAAASLCSDSLEIELARSDLPEEQQIEPQVEAQLLRVQSAAALDKADQLAGRGELEAGQRALASALERLELSQCASLPEVAALRGELEACTAGLSSQREYAFIGSKRMKSFAGSAWKQKSSVHSPFYSNSMQARFKQSAGQESKKRLNETDNNADWELV